jgi:hypothetical protein
MYLLGGFACRQAKLITITDKTGKKNDDDDERDAVTILFYLFFGEQTS